MAVGQWYGAIGSQRRRTLIMPLHRMWQYHRRLHVVLDVWWLLLVLLPVLGHAEQFTGKVVGISDGDTIRVLRGGLAEQSLQATAYSLRSVRRESGMEECGNTLG